MMEEGRRQGYLAALGLPLWVSRRLLPGAAPAEVIDFVAYEDEAAFADFEPEAVAAPVAAVQAPVARAEALMVRETAPSMRPAQLPVTSRPATPAAAPVAVTPTLTGSAEFPRFNFWFKPLPSGWQLLIALGDVPDLSGREHQLLEQIEAVLGGGSAAPTRFGWPLNNNPAIPRDAQSAREAVGAFLGRQRKAGGRYLLLGDELLPYMQTAFAGEKFAQGASLSQLLAEPARKRALWQSLWEQLG